MGIGFTLDTPIKVAKFGISSVISLADDTLMEKLRQLYCNQFNIAYKAITEKDYDFRAKRITAYLDLMHDRVREQVTELKKISFKKGNDLVKYFEMLPEGIPLKKEYLKYKSMTNSVQKRLAEKKLKSQIFTGSIDVNLMTKLDKVNYDANNEPLPQEFNDAHAAVRGFANSKVKSSLVFSAGMNPRLYNYLTEFDGFFPNDKGEVDKKIILKVSDYRSALVQGKILAKKGIWISEYRLESGLNCGGHAFATQGHLMGPILNDFKSNREALEEELSTIYLASLETMGKTMPGKQPSISLSAQGGIGNADEQEFLMEQYGLVSTGWGSPFLLVPEAVSIDNDTVDLLKNAEEDDLYLSDISPLGVPFNSVKGNTKDIEKQAAIDKGKPGSPCIRKTLVSNTEFTDKPICTASRQYQSKKIKELDTLDLSPEKYKDAFNKIVEKACICVGLGTPSLLVNNLSTKLERPSVSVCPGPNLAYFSKKFSLKEMVDHIYGKIDLLNQNARPHMFIKELGMYVDYLKKELNELDFNNKKQLRYVNDFEKNLVQGIHYYVNLLNNMKVDTNSIQKQIISALNATENEIRALRLVSVG
ncbi:MAG: hypothetical protein CL840_21480 [Crocinitomicaceae bacterium]|nr:hypothetical protein [Crocinitomicaceae bacterium]